MTAMNVRMARLLLVFGEMAPALYVLLAVATPRRSFVADMSGAIGSDISTTVSVSAAEVGST
jgi:hypothetical protein